MRKLIRERDNLIKEGEIMFIEYIDGFNNVLHKTPRIGYSIIVDPQYGRSFTWLTTPITEIISYNRFKTENSVYIIKL